MIFLPMFSPSFRPVQLQKKNLHFNSFFRLFLTASALQLAMLAMPANALCLSVSALQFSQPTTFPGLVTSARQPTTPAIVPHELPAETPVLIPAAPASPLSHENTPMQSFVDNVSKYFGTRYRFGGQTPAGFDCSGFVRYMYDKVFNMNLPRSSREMSAIGNKVSKDNLQPGDLVFFHSKRRRINHVGIFIGNDTFVHSSLSKGIAEDKLKYQYYEKRFAGAVRLLELPTLPLPPLPMQLEPAKEIIKPS